MYIARNKKFTSSIVLPENPTVIELFAKEELTKYLSDIVGIDYASSDADEYKIHIGSRICDFDTDDSASSAAIRDTEICGEGFLIFSTERELFLVGADSARAGALYAVYELLERYLGLSLSAYGRVGSDVGELIPRCDTLLIEPTLYVKKDADIAYRAAIVQYDNWLGNPDHKLNDSFISWLAKNRYNRILTWCGIYEGYKRNGMIAEAEKRGISFSVGHHEAFNTFLPAFGNEYFTEKYRETHPEYYKLLESGERYAFRDGDYSEQFTLCMRNEEMIAEFSQNAVSWLLQNPTVDVICLWPQDGDYPQCACDRCSRHSKSDNYTYFVSAVSAEISRSLPYIKIDRIAYMDLTEAPSERVSPSLIADVSVWLNTGLRHVGGCNGESFIGSPAEKIVTSWKDKGALSVYYDYLMGIYAERQRWMPIASEIPSLVRRMKDEGIYGLGTQIEPFNLWNNIVNFYTYGRCAYDTSLTLQDSLSRFCRIFGGAGAKVKEIIEYAETILDGSVTLDLASEHFIRNADREYIYRAFDEALSLADTPRARNNLRLMRMVFRYSELEIFSPRHGGKIPERFSDAVDPCGELWYMRENFDSYVSGNEGYGVAFPVWFKSNGNYLPDEWYDFEGE